MRILYIDIDALRPDHLGCYGYHRNTSPNIDRIAREGVRFTQFYTPDAPCMPSRTAFYSGRFGIQTGVVGHGGSAAQPKIEGRLREFRDNFSEEGLAHHLQKLGFHTAMISPFGQRHGAHWFYAGFNEIHNTGNYGQESAEEVRPVVDAWMQANVAKDNWYLHVNFWDAHTVYRVPAEYGEPFANDPLPEWLDNDEVIKRHMKTPGPHTAMEIGMYHDRVNPKYPRQPGKITDRASLRKMIDGYDTAIRYVDDHIGRVIEQLKAAGVYEDTAIIISADHGENQGELGIYGEHGTADDITCKVPLIVKWPGGKQAAVDDKFHYNIDVAPTLMSLLGGEPSGIWDGAGFASAIAPAAAKKNAATEITRSELILSQCVHVCQRSVRFGPWLYIRTYHEGFRLFPREMLFDVKNDPHEQHDLASAHPDLCREAAWRLMNWHDEQMLKMQNDNKTDPLWTVIAEGGPYHALHDPGRSPLPEYIKRLEATDRADSAAKLREKYAAFL